MQASRPRGYRVRLDALLPEDSLASDALPDTIDASNPAHAVLIARAVRAENQRRQELHLQRCPRVSRAN